MKSAYLVVGGGGLAAVGVLVVVAGRVGGTVGGAKAVGKFGGALVEVGAVEGGGVARGISRAGGRETCALAAKAAANSATKKRSAFLLFLRSNRMVN